jgi:hypothetical protein
MAKISMRAVDALAAGKITREYYEKLVKEYGLAKGRAYRILVEEGA